MNWETRLKFYDEKHDAASGLPKIRALVYGPSGIGKTTFCASFPNCFFLDCDRGGLTLRNRHIPAIEIERRETVFTTVWEILSCLKNKTGPFKTNPDLANIETLVIDSWSNLNDFILTDAMLHTPKSVNKSSVTTDPNNDKADFEDWGRLLQRQISIVSLLKDLEMNVLVTAGSGVDKDSNGMFIGGPVMKGSFDREIPFAFDEIYYLASTPAQEGVHRALYTGPYTYYTAKSRLGLPYKIVNKDPRHVPMYADLVALLEAK